MKARNFVVGLVILVMSISGVKAQSNFHNALDFQTTPFSQDYFEIPNDNGFNFQNSTIEFWINPLEYNGLGGWGSCTIIAKNPFHEKYYDGGSQIRDIPHLSWEFKQTYTNGDYTKPMFAVNTPFGWINQIKRCDIRKWYHLAVTFSNKEMKFYVDGELQGTIPVSYDCFFNYSMPIMAAQHESTYGVRDCFTGTMDELRIWNYPRTQQQIVDDKDKELTGTEPGLYTYYDFNSGNAGQNNAGVITIKDKSSSGNNTIVKSQYLNGIASNWVASTVGANLTTMPATSLGGGGFVANWMPPANGLIVEKYYIDVATDMNFSNCVTGYNNLDIGSVTSFQIVNLNPLTTYYYRVRGYLGGATTPNSTVTTVSTIDLSTQTISFNSLPIKTYGDADFTLSSATSTSGLPVTYSIDSYSSDNPGVMTLTNNVFHINFAGRVVITASQPGNTFYSAATPVKLAMYVKKAILTWKADNQTIAYGSNLFYPPFTITGWKNGDSTFPYFTPFAKFNITSATVPGFYPKAITFVSTPDTRYDYKFIEGDVTITPGSYVAPIKVDQSITFNSMPTRNLGDADFSPASASSGLSLNYSSSDSTVANIVNGRIHLVGQGSCTITASQAGDVNFNPATAVSQTLTVGNIRNALNFDGATNFVSCGSILTPSYTKEAWVKLSPSAGSVNNIISGTSNHFFQIFNGNLTASNNQMGASGFLKDDTSFPTNEWTHVAVTYDAASYLMKLYINGVAVKSAGLLPNTLDNSVFVGAYNNSGFFNGDIDDVKIWNRALSESELNNEYNNVSNSDNGLIVFYNMNQGTPCGNNSAQNNLINVIDQTKNGVLNNFSLSGCSSNFIASAVNAPVADNSLNLDGVDDYVDINYNSKLTAFQSISIWFNTTQSTAGRFISHNFKPGEYGGYKMGINNGQVVFGVADNLTAQSINCNTIAKYNDGIWHNAIVLFDINNRYVKIIVDGVQQPIMTLDGTAGTIVDGNLLDFSVLSSLRTTDSKSNFVLGKSTKDNSEFYSGSIDDLSLWSAVLTDAQILQCCTKTLKGNETGLIAYYNMNSGVANVDNTGKISMIDKSPTPANGILSNFTLNGNVSNWIGSSSTLSKSNQIIKFNDLSPKQVGDADFTPIAISSSGLGVSLTSSNPSVATIVDGNIHIVGAGSCIISANQSGNTYYKPAIQVDQNLVVAELNNALNFDGVNDFVNCGNILTNSYTKEAWIRTATNTGYLNIISGSLNHAFWVVNGQLCSGHNGTWFYVVDNSTIPLNTWTHVAVTYDAATTTMKLYTNGVLVATNSAVPAIAGDNSVLIGAFAYAALFSGDIDEVKIWNKVLSASEIAIDKSARLTGSENGLVAYYDFNSGIAGINNAGLTTLNDKSVNGTNGTLYNFALSGNSSNWVKSSIIVLKSQAAPILSTSDIDFPSEKIIHLAATMEYSLDKGSSWADVLGTDISIKTFISNVPDTINIRFKANLTSYASLPTTIILPARPLNIPAISTSDIDYVNSRMPISPSMQYSINGGAWNSVNVINSLSGISMKSNQTNELYINLSPYLYFSSGVNLSIRYEPTASSFGSNFVNVVIPGSPAAPTSPVEDTSNNTFGFTLNPLYSDLSAYEFSIDGGKTYQTVASNPITIGNQVIAVGDLSVRVKAVPTVSFAGLPLQNASAYSNMPTSFKNTEVSNLCIYPNPTKDYFMISCAAKTHVAIYDLKGRMLLNELANGKPIDIRSLAKGIYVLKVQSEGKQVVGKLVKE